MKTEADSRRSEHMSALRAALWQLRRATRAQLAEKTGLSTMTVGKLLAVMQSRGEVFQSETERAQSGRPSVIAQYCGDYRHFAAVVVEQKDGMSAFSMAVYNLFGEAVYRETLRVKEPEADCFDGFFERAVEAYRIELAVFVLPGVAKGEELLLCDLQKLKDGQALCRVREKFGIQVLFENDVNGAVLGHAFEKRGVFAGIYFPGNYCPGAGVVIDGSILYGKGNFTGEIGYIHGEEAWKSLDYSDEEAVCERIAQLLVIYACTLAPTRVVLYGEFLTERLRRAIRMRFEEKMMGRFAMEIDCYAELTQDMERGALRLGLDRMFNLIGEDD